MTELFESVNRHSDEVQRLARRASQRESEREKEVAGAFILLTAIPVLIALTGIVEAL